MHTSSLHGFPCVMQNSLVPQHSHARSGSPASSYHHTSITHTSHLSLSLSLSLSFHQHTIHSTASSTTSVILHTRQPPLSSSFLAYRLTRFSASISNLKTRASLMVSTGVRRRAEREEYVAFAFTVMSIYGHSCHTLHVRVEETFIVIMSVE